MRKVCVRHEHVAVPEEDQVSAVGRPMNLSDGQRVVHDRRVAAVQQANMNRRSAVERLDPGEPLPVGRNDMSPAFADGCVEFLRGYQRSQVGAAKRRMDAPGCRAFADILASSTRQSYKQSADNVDRGSPSHVLMKGSRHGGLMGILVG